MTLKADEPLAELLRAGRGGPLQPAGAEPDEATTEALREVDLLEAFLTGLLSRSREESMDDSIALIDDQFATTRRALGEVRAGEERRRLGDHVDGLARAYGTARASR